MIRDVVVHLHNEQPILVDLLAEPDAGDVCLVCTNLRTMNGKPPVFVERPDSTFVFPMAHVRFVEIRPGSESGGMTADAPDAAAHSARGLRRLPAPKKASRLAYQPDGRPMALDRLAWVGGKASEPPPEAEDETPGDDGEESSAQGAHEDELIRRVREV